MYVPDGINWPPVVAANCTVPAILVVVVENAGFVVVDVFSVPLLVSPALHVKPNVDISKIVEAGIVNAPVEVTAPIAVFVPLVLLNVSVAYVFAGINWPPVDAANSTVPAIIVVVVENAGFVVVDVFSVPLFVSPALHVKPNVDISNVHELAIVKTPVTVIEPTAVVVPAVIERFPNVVAGIVYPVVE